MKSRNGRSQNASNNFSQFLKGEAICPPCQLKNVVTPKLCRSGCRRISTKSRKKSAAARFSLFENRGRRICSDLENWFDAEKEVVCAPASEVIEAGDSYRARIALPGLQAKDLQVIATPDALIVKGETKHTHQERDGKVCLCEFSDKRCSDGWICLHKLMSTRPQHLWRMACR